MEREERLLSYPPPALGSVGGCRYSLPSPEQLSAYLEENQAWNGISLSAFQRRLLTKGLTFSEVSMKAGSTDRQELRLCGKEILLLPAEEVVPGGLLRHGEERQRSRELGAGSSPSRCRARGGFAVLLVLAGGWAALCRGRGGSR